MSYRPSNYLPSLYKRTGINVLVNYSYSSSTTLVKRETRYFDPNMILYLSLSSPNNGGIYLASDDLMPNATIVSQNSNFTNASNMFDHNDSTYAYDNGTSLGASTEQAEIVLNLGKAYSGFIYVNSYCYGTHTRIYTSPDNSTWTLSYDTGGAVGTYSSFFYVSNIQYIKLSVYNSSTSSLTLSTSYWYVNSLEFYPLPAPRTSIQGDGTNKFYVVGIYNTYYELLEVWNI